MVHFDHVAVLMPVEKACSEKTLYGENCYIRTVCTRGNVSIDQCIWPHITRNKLDNCAWNWRLRNKNYFSLRTRIECTRWDEKYVQVANKLGNVAVHLSYVPNTSGNQLFHLQQAWVGCEANGGQLQTSKQAIIIDVETTDETAETGSILYRHLHISITWTLLYICCSEECENFTDKVICQNFRYTAWNSPLCGVL